jgi:hypothetical protein
MSRGGRADEADAVVSRWAAVQVVEQAGAGAEKEGNNMDLHLIDQTRGQVLLGRIGAAAEGHVPAAGRLEGTLERRLDAVDDEVKVVPPIISTGSRW